MKEARNHKQRHAVEKMYRSHRAAVKKRRQLMKGVWAAEDAARAAEKSATGTII